VPRVEFVETPTFTRLIGKLMDDNESYEEGLF
jgi:hypothetical protein